MNLIKQQSGKITDHFAQPSFTCLELVCKNMSEKEDLSCDFFVYQMREQERWLVRGTAVQENDNATAAIMGGAKFSPINEKTNIS